MTDMDNPRRGQGEDGVVGAQLAIVLFFALFAVISLTRTVISVQQIDDRVKVIVGEVGPIDEDLTSVPKLDETDRLAAEILESAKPLSAQADEIIVAAQSIDGTVSNIQSKAGSINGSVKSIDASFAGLQPVVRSINDGVAAINGRVDRIIATVAAIRADLRNVLSHVGPASHGGGPKGITGHANAIDCNPAVAGQACGR
ncbi:MAG: hypothetical protein ACLGHT_11135 [Acidimicrobiia bacterium]